MSMLRELQAAGMAALQVPHALRRHGCGSAHHVTGRNAHHPVLLVHGYAGTESVWAPLRRALADAGFGYIVSLSYNSFAMDPRAVSAELTRLALQALAATGAGRIHLIGHSLGGLIVRSAIAANPELSGQTGGAVTIASPHHGISLARIAPGQCARIMHPGHRCAQPEAGGRGPVRWLAYYSDGDRIVPRHRHGSTTPATRRSTC
jgi:triacylglycerol esterase/lipase EstA (alpha/beta hydrolase family)